MLYCVLLTFMVTFLFPETPYQTLSSDPSYSCRLLLAWYLFLKTAIRLICSPGELLEC